MPNRGERFQHKLWRIVNDCKSTSIFWSNAGNSIVINFPKFKKEYLETGDFSKSNKIPSFVRQLNLYGFRKEVSAKNNSKDEHEFKNSYFMRGRKDLLQHVVRNSTSPNVSKGRRPGLRTIKKCSLPIKYTKEIDNAKNEKSEPRKRGRKGRPHNNKHYQNIKSNVAQKIKDNDHSYEKKQRRYTRKTASKKSNVSTSLKIILAHCEEDNQMNRKWGIKSKATELQQHKEEVTQSTFYNSKIQEKLHTESTLIERGEKPTPKEQNLSIKEEIQVARPDNFPIRQILELNDIQPINNKITQRATILPENDDLCQQIDVKHIEENETEEKNPHEMSDILLMEEMPVSSLDSAQFLNDFILPPECKTRSKPHSYLYYSTEQEMSVEFRELRDTYFKLYNPFKIPHRYNFCICPHF